MRLKLHPDGFISLKDDGVVYIDACVDFERAAKMKIPPLPEGMVMATYDTDTKVLVFTDAKGGAHPVEGAAPWEIGDAVIASVLKIMAERAAQPPAPPVTPAPEPVQKNRGFPLQRIQTKEY
jgi:hypothetical protein